MDYLHIKTRLKTKVLCSNGTVCLLVYVNQYDSLTDH